MKDVKFTLFTFLSSIHKLFMKTKDIKEEDEKVYMLIVHGCNDGT